MYLPEALWCTATVTPRSKSLSKGGAKGQEEKEDRCTHATTKDKNESYYTEAKGASKLHNLLISHQGADGEGSEMPVGDIL